MTTAISNWLNSLSSDLFSFLTSSIPSVGVAVLGLIVFSLVFGFIAEIVSPTNYKQKYDDYLFKR